MTFNAINSLVNVWGMGIEGAILDQWFEEINKPEYNILEVGFGKGNLLKRLDKPKLCGVDASQTNFRYALGENQVKAELCLIDISTDRLPYPDGHFDVVVMLEVLEHILSPLHAILEIKRVLKKDGLFLFSWPEERLISGIGKEEDNSKRRYDSGFHSFPYPGLFKYENMRVFFNQLYFRIIEEEMREYHIFFKMQNTKVDRPEILDVVNSDYSHLYDDIVTSPQIII